MVVQSDEEGTVQSEEGKVRRVPGPGGKYFGQSRHVKESEWKVFLRATERIMFEDMTPRNDIWAGGRLADGHKQNTEAYLCTIRSPVHSIFEWVSVGNTLQKGIGDTRSVQPERRYWQSRRGIGDLRLATS